MTAEEKRSKIQYQKNRVNSIKSELFDIVSCLEEIGAVRASKSLWRIIGDLEDWQNR